MENAETVLDPCERPLVLGHTRSGQRGCAHL